jgi:hypothetical protein
MNSDHLNRWRNGSVLRCGLSESNKFIFLTGGFQMSWTFKCNAGKIAYLHTRKLSDSEFRGSERWAKRKQLNELHFANATNKSWSWNVNYKHQAICKCPANNTVRHCLVESLLFKKHAASQSENTDCQIMLIFSDVYNVFE